MKNIYEETTISETSLMALCSQLTQQVEKEPDLAVKAYQFSLTSQ
jgi:hypothetical protein